MNSKEKLLGIQLILEDIRCNWGDDLTDRLTTVKGLIRSLADSEEYGEDMKHMLSSVAEYEDMLKEDGVVDGRFFAEDYPYGYYEMDIVHGLEKTLQDKSDEFKENMKCLTHPEDRFNDYNEVI